MWRVRGIAGAAIISVLAAGVLYYKWYKDRPDGNQTTIIVGGTEDTELDGAKVIVYRVLHRKDAYR